MIQFFAQRIRIATARKKRARLAGKPRIGQEIWRSFTTGEEVSRNWKATYKGQQAVGCSIEDAYMSIKIATGEFNNTDKSWFSRER